MRMACGLKIVNPLTGRGHTLCDRSCYLFLTLHYFLKSRELLLKYLKYSNYEENLGKIRKL